MTSRHVRVVADRGRLKGAFFVFFGQLRNKTFPLIASKRQPGFFLKSADDRSLASLMIPSILDDESGPPPALTLDISHTRIPGSTDSDGVPQE